MRNEPLNDIRLIRLLGAGGAGEVWLGSRGRREQPVAVKLITGPEAASPDVRRLFMHELRATAALDHPGVIAILDHGAAPAELVEPCEERVVPGAPVLVMELLEGGSLARLSTGVPFVALQGLLKRILAALAHAHARGVLHRDIKPDNILLDRDGMPRIADFGLAWVRELENPIESRVLGTPGYVAPEQIGKTDVLPSPATDLYSLACTAWALATGSPPFGRKRNVISVLHDHRYTQPPVFEPLQPTPVWFEVWLRRCLQKDPRARFRDAPAALAGLGPRPRPPRLTPPRARPAGLRSDPSPRLLGLRNPLLGRESEKETLWERLLGVREERTAQVVSVGGSSGMGKSQLLNWLGTAAAEHGLAEVIPLRSDDRGGELIHAIAQRLGPDAANRNLLAYSFGVPVEDPWLGALWALLAGHTAGGRASHTALIAWALARLGGERPALILFDGPQSSDTAQLLEMLADHPTVGPILAVVALRPDGLSAVANASLHLNLDPIPPERLRPLLDQLVRLDGPLAARLSDRCGGSPLLALSLLESWRDQGALRRGQNGWELAEGTDRELPADLTALPRQRIEEVVQTETEEPESVLQALELAAVLGVEVDDRAWRLALDFVSLPQPDAPMEALFDRGLLSAERALHDWRFAHGLLREAMLARAREGGRATRWHSVAAAILAAEEGDVAAERCGRHLLAAGRPDEAATSLLVGAELRKGQGAIEYALGLVNAAEKALHTARVPEADQRWGRLWITRSVLELDRRGTAAAEYWANKALETSRRHPWRLIAARALYQLGRAALNRGDGPATERLLGEAAERAAELGDPWLLGRCYRELGSRRSETGNLTGAEELLLAAVEELEDDRDPASQGYAYVLLAANCIRHGDSERAAGYVAKATPRFERGGSVRGLAIARNLEGEVARKQGDWPLARAAYEESAAMHRRGGSSMSWFALSNLGLLEALHGDSSTARSLLEQCIEGFELAGRGGYVAHPMVYLLPALAGLADWGALAEQLPRAREVVERAKTRDPDLIEAAQFAANAAEAAGRVGLAADCMSLVKAIERR